MSVLASTLLSTHKKNLNMIFFKPVAHNHSSSQANLFGTPRLIWNMIPVSFQMNFALKWKLVKTPTKASEVSILCSISLVSKD